MTARSPFRSDIPVLPALPAHAGGCCLRVWCVYCRRRHVHGAGPGHRVAHCDDDRSPYAQTGYVLELEQGS